MIISGTQGFKESQKRCKVDNGINHSNGTRKYNVIVSFRE